MTKHWKTTGARDGKPATLYVTTTDELIAEGGAISISNALELEEVFNRLFNHETEYKWRSDVAEKFVEIKAGATQKIFDYIQANRLLTN